MATLETPTTKKFSRKHPEGKFFIKSASLGGYYYSTVPCLSFSPAATSRGKKNQRLNIHYFDSFRGALIYYMKIPEDWREEFSIYKATKHKNKKCFSNPKNQRAKKNVIKQYNF